MGAEQPSPRKPSSPGNRSIVPGQLVLAGFCGWLDAVSFLALGGIFSETMTGNLLFAAISLGSGQPPEQVYAFLIPLSTFSVGAVVGGAVLYRWRELIKPRRAFMVVFTLVVAATIMTLVLGADGENAAARLVVGVLALGMGLQNAILLVVGRANIATNVMTQTLARALSSLPLVGGDNADWQFRFGSIGCFVVGAIGGALAQRWGPVAGLTGACLIFAMALPWLSGEHAKSN